MQQALIAMVDGMTASTDGLMREVLGEEMEGLDQYHQQIQRIKQRHLFQCLTFFGLAHLCSIKPMDAFVVSNLDGGINGPLFSAAQDVSAPSYMLPHSHIVNHESDGPCTVITEYWQPKPSMTYHGEVNTIIHLESENSSKNISGLWEENRPCKVMILFNGIHRWTSLNISIDFLKDMVSEIAQLCLNENVELIYRLKPGDQTPLDAYSQLLGIDREKCQIGLHEKLDDMLKNTSLVISIDDPSTALWSAIEFGCAVVLISNRQFIPSTVIDGDILDGHTPEQGLNLIEQLLSNPKKLNQMRLMQFSKLHNMHKKRILI
jgi:hypothetical protein